MTSLTLLLMVKIESFSGKERMTVEGLSCAMIVVLRSGQLVESMNAIEGRGRGEKRKENRKE